MEVNIERIPILKGISLKRVMRLNCPRVRSSLSYPLLVCIGLTTLIAVHSLIHKHYGYNEELIKNTIVKSLKSSASTENVFLPTTTNIIEDENKNVSENKQPYEWIKDDFFSPYKGRVITKNERKYQPKIRLRFNEDRKTETNNLKLLDISSSISKEKNKALSNTDTENNINGGKIDEKSFGFVSKNFNKTVFANSLIGPNGFLQSFSKGESGYNPGALPRLITAAKQWQSTSVNNQDKNQLQIKNISLRNETDVTMSNKSTSYLEKQKRLTNNMKSEQTIKQKETYFQGLGSSSTLSNGNAKSGLRPVLSGLAPLVSVVMKHIGESSNMKHKPPSLADSLMGNIAPVLIQGAIGRLVNAADKEDKPISAVESLIQNIGPAVLQGVMNGAGTSNMAKHHQPSGFVSLIAEFAPKLLNGFLTGRRVMPKDINKVHVKPSELSKRVVFADTPQERIKRNIPESNTNVSGNTVNNIE